MCSKRNLDKKIVTEIFLLRRNRSFAVEAGHDLPAQNVFGSRETVGSHSECILNKKIVVEIFL